LKAVRKTLEEGRKALTCRVRVLPYEEYSRLREDPKATLTPEHHAGYERWKIEETVGLTINEQIYDYFQHPADRAALRLFTDLETSTGKLLARDRKELKNDVLLPNRGHYTRRIEIINELLRRLFPNGLDSNEELTIGDINRLIQSVQDLLPEFHLYFRSRSDRSQKPIAVLRQILRRLGLKLTGRRVQRSKVRFWLYRIDIEHLNQWRMFAAARREHLQQKKAERADRATFRDNSGSVSFRKVARRWENRPGTAFPPSRSSPGGTFRPPAV
jgi:hypothetical protein